MTPVPVRKRLPSPFFVKRKKALARATRPPQRPFHRLADHFRIGRVRETFIEHHRDVRTELGLDVDRLLRRQQMRRAVEMRAKSRAFLVDGPPRGQAEHLVAAAVGQDGTRPPDERMEAATPRDQVVARPQIEVIRVAQEDVGAELLEIPVQDALDGALRADRHEGGRRNVAVRGRHHAAAGAAIPVGDAKGEAHWPRRTVYNPKSATTEGTKTNGRHGSRDSPEKNSVLCVSSVSSVVELL